jgi:acyl-CoA thioester hydrolase
MKSTSRIVVRYAETDQMGIAHHSVYPVWFEVARTDLIRNAGVQYSEMERRGLMLPLCDLACHYAFAAHYEEVLRVEAAVASLSAARIVINYRVLREDDGVLLAWGSTTHGFVRSDTFRAVNAKKAFPEFYRLLEGAMEQEKK